LYPYYFKMTNRSITVAQIFIGGLWCIVFFSFLALVFHVRWFIPCLINKVSYTVPPGQNLVGWFLVQITSNILFLYVSLLLIRLIRNYQRTKFLDAKSFKVLNVIIAACLLLALMGAGQFIANHYSEMKIESWVSAYGILNGLLRVLVKFLFIENPQTMYFLIAMIVWVLKQFIVKALEIKNENESFI